MILLKIFNLIQNEQKADKAVNVTGGTKTLSLAALSAAWLSGCRAFIIQEKGSGDIKVELPITESGYLNNINKQMKKKSTLIIIVILYSVFIRAQDFTALWEGHFSYLNIKDVVTGSNKIYAASENAVFKYDLETFQIEKINTVSGLSGELISTIYYSENLNQLIIGYENGLIEIFIEATSEVIDSLKSDAKKVVDSVKATAEKM